MAKVRLNPVMEQIRGHLGELVFKRYGDGVIVTRKADLEGLTPTPAQAEHRARFQQAAQYGRSVMADPALKAVYLAASKERGIPLFSCTIADFFNAPSVSEVDLKTYTGKGGDKIAFQAVDDFGVVSARVAITGSDGSLIESGSAAETNPGSGLWSYTATQSIPPGTHVRVTATATDRPGGHRNEPGGEGHVVSSRVCSVLFLVE